MLFENKGFRWKPAPPEAHVPTLDNGACATAQRFGAAAQVFGRAIVMPMLEARARF